MCGIPEEGHWVGVERAGSFAGLSLAIVAQYAAQAGREDLRVEGARQDLGSWLAGGKDVSHRLLPAVLLAADQGAPLISDEVQGRHRDASTRRRPLASSLMGIRRSCYAS